MTLGAAVVVLAVAIGGWRYVTPVPVSAAKLSPVPVVVTKVERGDVPIVLKGLGTVQADNTAIVRSQVTGLLQSVNFKEGQAVKRGDLLAQVDPRPNQARLDQAKAQLARDQAQLTNIQTNLDRNVPLLKQGFATDQQVANQKSQLSQMESTVMSDQAAVEDAQTQLSYTSLVAPFDGITGIRTLDVGNVIHPTDATGLVTVAQVQPISVLFTLPASTIPDVQTSLKVGEVSAIAFDQSGSRQLDTGHLLLINNQADPATGTVQLKALFPNSEKRLWPGVFVNVELILRTVKDGLTIPTNAIQQGANGEFVFVVDAGGKVSSRRVTVTQRERGRALVGAGLNAGETVVTQGQYRLVPGTVVTSSSPDKIADGSTATAGMLP